MWWNRPPARAHSGTVRSPLGCPDGRIPQLVGRRRALAVRPWILRPDRHRHACGAGNRVRTGHTRGRSARPRHPADGPNPPRRTAVSTLPKSRVTLVLLILAVLV